MMRILADNIQPMNSIVAQAVKDLNPEPIRDIAKRCESAGAEIIDINPGPTLGKRDNRIVFLVEAVQEVTDLRLCLDSNNAEVLGAGLRACRRKPIINGFSLEPKKLNEILPLAVEFDTEIVGFLLSPDGRVPADSEGRLDTALKLVEETKKAGLKLERLIIDPLLVPIVWGDGRFQAKELLSTIKLLPGLLDFRVNTIVGLSNLTSGIPFNEKTLLLEEVFFSMLAESGLNMVLMNVFHNRTMQVAGICKAIMDSRVFSWAEI